MSNAISHSQVPYEPPRIPQLLSLAAYLYLLSFTSSFFSKIVNAPLLGPLLIGILFGPGLAGLLPESTQSTFIDLGYVGLLLIVFEAGLTTDMSLLVGNLGLSVVAALTGIGFPIALSMALLKGAFGYSSMQAFAGGAALSSTSLGTTLALLTPELRTTRVGSVLMSAALLDDVVGLVIAAIIPNLATSEHKIAWQTIVRPILVSVAFAVFVPLLAYAVRKLLPRRSSLNWTRYVDDMRVQLFLIVAVLSGFVASSQYAGTSELFGAYLAGSFMTYVFSDPRYIKPMSSTLVIIPSQRPNLYTENPSVTPVDNISLSSPAHATPTMIAYTTHLEPILQVLLGPIFFASIGAALPIGSLFSANGSHVVVWHGLVYSVFMVLAKMTVGLWMLIWPEPGWFGKTRSRILGRREQKDPAVEDALPKPGVASTLEGGLPHPGHGIQNVDAHNAVEKEVPGTVSSSNADLEPKLEPSRRQSALLLSLAMVARGEIALIVAQLARPILLGSDPQSQDEEPFAVVIWAILVSTIGGALGVGVLLKIWKSRRNNC